MSKHGACGGRPKSAFANTMEGALKSAIAQFPFPGAWEQGITKSVIMHYHTILYEEAVQMDKNVIKLNLQSSYKIYQKCRLYTFIERTLQRYILIRCLPIDICYKCHRHIYFENARTILNNFVQLLCMMNISFVMLYKLSCKWKPIENHGESYPVNKCLATFQFLIYIHQIVKYISIHDWTYSYSVILKKYIMYSFCRREWAQEVKSQPVVNAINSGKICLVIFYFIWLL